MYQETRARVKTEVVDEVDVPSSIESTTVAAMDLEAKAHVKIEERSEVDVPPTSTVGAFAESVFPEWRPMSIKDDEVLEDPLAFPDCTECWKKEPDEGTGEDQAVSEDVPSTLYVSNTTSTAAGCTMSTTLLGHSNEAVGLKTHISAVLGGLLDRDLDNMLESGLSPNVSGHFPTHSQLTSSLGQKVTARRSVPSSWSKSMSTSRPRRVFDTELAKQVLRQLDSKPSPTGPYVAPGPTDASELQPYPCFYCECRFEQQSTRNTHLLYAHTKAITHARGPRELRVLRRALQPRSSWSIGENHGLSQRPVLQKLHSEPEIGVDNSTPIHICGVGAQQTVLQEDNSYISADNERLTEDTVCEFTCSSCQMSFSSKYSLTMHVFIHIEGVEPPSHICRSCGNVCLTRVSLSNHLRMHECGTVHAAVELYKCHVCDKSFFETASLKAHERVHSALKFHKCHVCSKLFRRAFDLKVHTSIHSGVKPYKCHICSKGFVMAYLLKRHQLIHSGMMPHKCHVCSKSFLSPSLLQRHTLIHSGMKPHKCDTCGKLFARTYDLKRHALIHFRMKPHK